MAMGPGRAEGPAAPRPGSGLPEACPAASGGGEGGGGGCEVPDREGDPSPRVSEEAAGKEPLGGLGWKEQERAHLQRRRVILGDGTVCACVEVWGVSAFPKRKCHGMRSPPPLRLLIFCRTLEGGGVALQSVEPSSAVGRSRAQVLQTGAARLLALQRRVRPSPENAC